MIRLSTIVGLALSSLTLSGCAGKAIARLPPKADVQAVVEAKPKPLPDILTDPAASDRHNAAIEARGDRIHAAGVRLCRFFQRTGMKGLTC